MKSHFGVKKIAELVGELYRLRETKRILEEKEKEIVETLRPFLEAVGTLEVDVDGKTFLVTAEKSSTIRYSSLLGALCKRLPDLPSLIDELKPNFTTQYLRIIVRPRDSTR